jgi:hypothetical protein
VAKWVFVLLLAVGVLAALSATGVLASAHDAPDRVKQIVESGSDDANVQSGAQVSQYEFNAVAEGTTSARLRALVGEPASRQSTEVEGIAVECWYYGVARATGAYQFCFQNGRLRLKARFTVPVRSS